MHLCQHASEKSYGALRHASVPTRVRKKLASPGTFICTHTWHQSNLHCLSLHNQPAYQSEGSGGYQGKFRIFRLCTFDRVSCDSFNQVCKNRPAELCSHSSGLLRCHVMYWPSSWFMHSKMLHITEACMCAISNHKTNISALFGSHRTRNHLSWSDCKSCAETLSLDWGSLFSSMSFKNAHASAHTNIPVASAAACSSSQSSLVWGACSFPSAFGVLWNASCLCDTLHNVALGASAQTGEEDKRFQ